MKKLIFPSTLAWVIAGILFGGCAKDEVLVVPGNDQLVLKSASNSVEIVCLPSVYSLVTQNDRQVGHITVSNDENFLTVEFAGDEWTAALVQLWVGADPTGVPKNRQYIPVTGKFPYKNAGFTTFQIPLNELFTIPPGGSFNGMEVNIFAHAESGDAETVGEGEESAWSEGTSFHTTRWGTYSTYTVCTQPRGCSPHTALGGDLYIDGIYYYDNTLEDSGAQAIYADNGKVAGTLEYASGTLSFWFEQAWSFTDLLPEPSLKVYGYAEEPGTEPVLVIEGEPLFNMEDVTITVPVYSYYKILLNVQECY